MSLRRLALLAVLLVTASLAVGGVATAGKGERSDRRAAAGGADARGPGAERADRAHRRGGHGHGHGHRELSPRARALYREVRAAVLTEAVTVGGPVVDRALAAGTIDAAAASTLREALAAAARGDKPDVATLRPLLDDAGARATGLAVVRALAARAPALAGPVLDRAVADGRLRAGRRDRLERRAARFSRRLARPQVAVLLDVAARAVSAAPSIAAPVLDRAVADGRFTREQAEVVLTAIRTLDVRPAIGALILDRADAKSVGRDVLRALAAGLPAVSAPVIDAAVADGRLRPRQGERLERRIARHLARMR